MLTDLRAGTFRTQLNTVFSIHLSPVTDLAVELVEVIEKGGLDGQQPPAATRQERFSVVFRGGRDRLLEQAMYHMQHDQLGDLELFLVPVGQDQTSVYYEAVFNRLRQADA
jgi:hypothetical protein